LFGIVRHEGGRCDPTTFTVLVRRAIWTLFRVGFGCANLQFGANLLDWNT